MITPDQVFEYIFSAGMAVLILVLIFKMWSELW